MASFFATTAKGTEGALKSELRAKHFRGVRGDRGGVHFEGPLLEGYRACVELACPMRVLLAVGAFEAQNEQALYEGMRAIDWSPYLSDKTTLAVRSSTRSSALTHSQYVAQKSKDAIVDQLRDRLGARPSVNLDDPDVVVSVHLARDHATVHLDLSGTPLFQRGYRVPHQGAPLKETLAASLLWLAELSDDKPFVDPMCGSGTLAIEAALSMTRSSPGRIDPTRRFGFQRWLSFGDEDARALAEILERAGARVLAPHEVPEVVARDLDPAALRIAEESARRAGVKVRFERGDVGELRGTRAMTVVTNPPYGERMSFSAQDARRMGQALAGLAGSDVAIITGDKAMLRAIPMRSEKEIVVMNGDLECVFARYRPRSRP